MHYKNTTLFCKNRHVPIWYPDREGVYWNKKQIHLERRNYHGGQNVDEGGSAAGKQHSRVKGF